MADALNDAESAHASARSRTRERIVRLKARGALERAHRIGVTGPPGAGKSTLVAALVRVLRARRRTVGVLAVDPSSVRTGGALLGDRVRLSLDPHDEGVFVRSLATRGELGGLARSVPVSMLLLSAAFDVAIVETVGIGQSEAEVQNVVDTVLFVIQPGSGDTIQFLKAGILEVPDVFAVNKADDPAARATERDLRSSQAALRAAGVLDRDIPIRTTVATRGEGVPELLDGLDAHHATLVASGGLANRRVEGAVGWIVSAFQRRFGELSVERRGGHAAIAATIRAKLAAGADALSVLGAIEEAG